MASGHPSYATFHAGSVETLVRRLSTPPINLPPSLIESLDLICVVSHVKDIHKNMRRLKEIREIIEVSDDGRVKSNQIIQWIPTTDKHVYNPSSRIVEKISNKLGITQESIQNEIIVRAQLLLKIKEKQIYEFKEVAKIINSYYKDKEATLKAFDIDSKTIDLIRSPVLNKNSETIKTFNIKDVADDKKQNKELNEQSQTPQINPQMVSQMIPQSSSQVIQNSPAVQTSNIGNSIQNNKNNSSVNGSINNGVNGDVNGSIEIPKMKTNPNIMSKIEGLKSKQDKMIGRLSNSALKNNGAQAPKRKLSNKNVKTVVKNKSKKVIKKKIIV